GANYVTFDGSNTTNGTSKDLTISNNSNTGTFEDAPTIMIKWASSNNTIKNRNVKGGANGGFAAEVITIGDSSTTGTRNNNISIINNDVKNVSSLLPLYGIYFTGP